MAKYIFYLALAVAVTVLALPLFTRRGESDSRLLQEGEDLCLNQEWNLARATLKQYLTRRPEDPAGHFYLGRAYMYGSQFRPIMAEGEFLTALRLFRKQGGKSPIERFPDRYFEMMCYLEAAKANLIQIDVYMSAGMSVNAVQELVDECAYFAGRARKIIPNAKEVAELDQIVRDLRPPGYPRRNPRKPRITITPQFTV